MSKFYGRKTNIFSAVIIAVLVIATLVFLGITFKDEIGNLFNKFKDNSNEIIEDIKDKNNKDTEGKEDGETKETPTTDSEVIPTASLTLGDYVVEMSYLTV